jgi:hypothetical protein
LIDRRIDFDQWEFCVVWATRISFLDVLSAVPPFLSHARKSKPAERRDRSSASTTACSKILLQSPKFLFSHKISLSPKRWKKSRKFRQIWGKCIRPYEKSSIITLPENLGKLSTVPSMNVSAPHICLCSSRGVRCLIDNGGGVEWQKALNGKFWNL